MKTLPDIYDTRIAEEGFKPDETQRVTLAGLENLRQDIEKSEKFTILRRLLLRQKKAVRGYYLYGGVGRGKSMVMDLFFDHVGIRRKRRVHFHAFMLEVHDFLHAARRAGGGRIDGALIACADKIARETRLLCFDEFQVKDVADAMILGRLFTALFRRGVVVVMTSNIPPDHLYEGGLQRDRFLPFIALLKERLAVVHFIGNIDYRLNRLVDEEMYFTPLGPAADAALERLIDVMADGHETAPVDLAVKGRLVHVPRAVREVAIFPFSVLCEEARSAVDYLELARRFRVFVVRDVPVMTDQQRDAVLRFVTLIDALYDHRARLVMSAAAVPELLYQGDTHAGIFARTVSRLMEMQSREYRSRAD